MLVVIALILFMPFQSLALDQTFSKDLIEAKKVKRKEFRLSGDHLLYDLKKACEVLHCSVQRIDKRAVRITLGENSIIWDAKVPGTVKRERGVHQGSILLPVQAQWKGDHIFFPLRSLADLLGYNNLFSNGKIRVFSMPERTRKLSLNLKKTLQGINLSFSYFIDAIETDHYIYLTFDYSNRVYIFDKQKNYSFSHFEFDRKYGYVRELEAQSPDKIFVTTKKGYIFHWDGKSQTKLLNSKASKTIEKVGESLPLEEVSFSSLSRLAITPKSKAIFVTDDTQKRLYRIDSQKKRITYYADLDDWDWHLDLGTYKDNVVLYTYDKKKKFTSPVLFTGKKVGKAKTSSCSSKLFLGLRIYGGQYDNKKNLWYFLDSSSRNIIQAEFNFSENGKCANLNSIHTGDETAFLNGFGQNLSSSPHIMVIDSDGFNLVRYFYKDEPKFELIKKSELLYKANIRWINPISIASNQNHLFVLGNLSHQIFDLESIDQDRGKPFFATGEPARTNVGTIEPLKAHVGYPSYVTTFEGAVWVADHYGRRIIEVSKGVARQMFPPSHPKYHAGISGFAVNEDSIYISDPILGIILKYDRKLKRSFEEDGFFSKLISMFNNFFEIKIKEPQQTDLLYPVAGYLPKEGVGDSEVFRRKAAGSSILEMKTFDQVLFGLPQSVIFGKEEDHLIVSDLYRHGVWKLNLKDKSVEPLAGFRSSATYHFGSYKGNLGLSGKEARLDSPGILSYSKQRDIYLLPSVYGSHIVAFNSDFSKTCEIHLSNELRAPYEAIVLDSGELAIADSASHNIYLYELPQEIPCLDKNEINLYLDWQ